MEALDLASPSPSSGHNTTPLSHITFTDKRTPAARFVEESLQGGKKLAQTIRRKLSQPFTSKPKTSLAPDVPQQPNPEGLWAKWEPKDKEDSTIFP